MENKKMKEAFDAAYFICHEMKCFTGNVIASDGKENAEPRDLELNKKASIYIKWYDKTFNIKK